MSAVRSSATGTGTSASASMKSARLSFGWTAFGADLTGRWSGVGLTRTCSSPVRSKSSGLMSMERRSYRSLASILSMSLLVAELLDEFVVRGLLAGRTCCQGLDLRIDPACAGADVVDLDDDVNVVG